MFKFDIACKNSPSQDLWSGSSQMTNAKLKSRDEQEMVEARREFYENTAKGSEKDMLQLGNWIGKKGIPIFVTFFSILYWGYGISHYLF